MKKSTTKALFKDSLLQFSCFTLAKRSSRLNDSVHVLLHTYVSILIAEGIPVTKIAKMIGDTQEMVIKAYAQSLAYEELKHE